MIAPGECSTAGMVASLDACAVFTGPVDEDDCPTAELWPIQRRSALEYATSSVSSCVAEVAVGSILRYRYIMEQVVGRGADSIVFRARDMHRVSADEPGDNVLAVKVLRPERRTNVQALTRLKREFHQMQCLSHPGIVRVFDLDCHGDIWFMSMELVAAQTIRARLQAPLSRAEALRIIAACCEALEYAHSRDILHGDLKPSNVLLDPQGRVKLIDFGSALSPGSHGAPGSDPSLAATYRYASPQILAGSRAERRDDIFSLAWLSYSLLSGGAHPFDRKSEPAAAHAPLAPTYVPAVPARLYEVIARGLSAERERRPASVGEFLRDLTGTGLSRGTVPAGARMAAPPVAPLAPAPPAAPAAPTLAAAGERYRSSRGAWARADYPPRMLSLVALALGMMIVLRHAAHPSVLRTADPPTASTVAAAESTASAAAAAPMQPDPAGTASSEVPPPTQPAPRASGTISFDGSVLRASAAQSMVAIPVKRLQ